MIAITQLFIIASVLVPSAQSADDRFAQGLADFVRGDYAAAAEHLQAHVQDVAGGNAARALYVLASIQQSQDQLQQARETLEQLIAEHPSSVWSLHASQLLAEQATRQNDWSRVITLTSDFLEVYIARPPASLDDRTCIQAYQTLLTAASKQSAGISETAQLRQLQKQFSAETATGKVLRLHSRQVLSAPDNNRVINPGFEWDRFATPTPVGWSIVGTEPEPYGDFDGLIRATAELQAHGGELCTGKYTSYGTHRGWLLQTVSVESGQSYEVTAFAHTPANHNSPGQVRLGVDLSGQQDPQADSVHWTQYVSAVDEYQRIGFQNATAVTATGGQLTVFLELRQDVAVANNAMLFDDVSVQPVEQ
jgi:tetratricopeptide (TPR) repeat protein